MNGICAGGTGSFIDQMASLLQTDASGLNDYAKNYKALYPIAARCGVFAKTDIQPLINEGATKEDLSASIFQAVVNQTISGLACGKPIRGHVAFLGGPLHFLTELKTAFIRTLKLDDEHAITPENSHLFAAIGSALNYKEDEKNMRWALNKFFYTKHKNSLPVAYTLLLKEKYCDSLGNLLPEYPSFYQFRYFYRRTKKMQTYYISRDGLKDYQKNNRPLLGDGIQEYASSVGMGMLDATVCDIYLVNEAGNLVGRPILTACIDAYSSLCCGYSLSWEGGVYSLRGLMLNIISDKQKWCSQYGISIEKSQWDADKLPAIFVTDMGSEYKSENFEQITELGVTVVNLPSYRPELKGAVEKFFDLVQNTYKPHLKGKGVIEPDYQERGSHDYRKDACLTMTDFEKVILRCIIYYNSQRIIENFPYTEGMIQNQIQPFASNIWEWGKTQTGANLITFYT